MPDALLAHVGWIGALLERPLPESLPDDPDDREVLSALRDGWGVVDTADLLHDLTERYGDRARDAVGRFIEACLRRDWAAAGAQEAHPGTEIDDFIRILWGPLPALGFEFTSTGDGDERRFHVTRCPVYEAAAATGTTAWMYTLACATDEPASTSFSPQIEFDRTTTLMQGGPCCDHHYRRRPPE